jgi:chromosome condensin MukBEF ATPase and DNA-binding subunit MukB
MSEKKEKEIAFNFGSLLKGSKKESKEGLETCPYCQKDFKKLAQHINKCPNNPDRQNKTKNYEEIEELKLHLNEQEESIQKLTEDLRKLQHHKLTEENIIDYFRTVKYAKKYELYRAFTPHDTREIEKIVDKLYKEGILTRAKGHWYKFRPKTIKEGSKSAKS